MPMFILFSTSVFWPFVVWQAMVDDAVKATRKPTLVLIVGGKAN